MSIDLTGNSASGIAADLRTRIERGELAPGTLLPSVRAVAVDLGVNRNTVVAAYRQLAQAGLVE
ncbi:winged helix-turn-helix domain-containing protein, partial [uncultured Microbacterium sp.]